MVLVIEDGDLAQLRALPEHCADWLIVILVPWTPWWALDALEDGHSKVKVGHSLVVASSMPAAMEKIGSEDEQ